MTKIDKAINLGITGTINGMNWDGDVNFTYDAANENWYIENFTVNAGEIMKIRVAGRGTHICTRCQK